HARIQLEAAVGPSTYAGAGLVIVPLHAADPATGGGRALGDGPREARVEAATGCHVNTETARDRERVGRRRREPRVHDDAAGLVDAHLAERERRVVGIARVEDPVVVEVLLAGARAAGAGTIHVADAVAVG